MFFIKSKMSPGNSQTISVSWLDGAVVVFFLALTFVITQNFHYISYDDAYITFRYADNLASGKGLVYNPGEQFLGTTTPLLAVLLAILSYILPVDIPILGGWMSGLALGAGAILLYLTARDFKQRLTGVASGLILLINPLIIITLGGEATLLLALVLAVNFFYFRHKFFVAGILVGFAFLTRGEGFLIGVPLFAHYVITQKRLPSTAIVGFVLVTLPWFMFSLYTFGSPLPSTLSAKIAQGKSGLWPLFWRGTVEWLKGFTVGSVVYAGLPADWRYLMLTPLLSVGAIGMLINRPKQWWPILMWSILQMLGYSLFFNVPFYHWYVAPLVLSLVLLVGYGVEIIVDLVMKLTFFRNDNLVRPAMGLIIVVGLLAPPSLASLNFLQNHHRGYPNPAEAIYRTTGEWLAANTHPEASVGYFEIGFIGYYSNRPIVDPLGLVNPGVAERVARRDFLWALQYYKPDYIIYNSAIFREWIGDVATEQPWFFNAYQEIKQIEYAAYPGSPLVIFHLKDRNAVPFPSQSR